MHCLPIILGMALGVHAAPAPPPGPAARIEAHFPKAILREGATFTASYRLEATAAASAGAMQAVSGPSVPALENLSLAGSSLTDEARADGTWARTLELTLQATHEGTAHVGAVFARVGDGAPVETAPVDLTVGPPGPTAGAIAGAVLLVLAGVIVWTAWRVRRERERARAARAAAAAPPVIGADDLARLAREPSGAQFLDRARQLAQDLVLHRLGLSGRNATASIGTELRRPGVAPALATTYETLIARIDHHRFAPEPPSAFEREEIVALLKSLLHIQGRGSS